MQSQKNLFHQNKSLHYCCTELEKIIIYKVLITETMYVYKTIKKFQQVEYCMLYALHFIKLDNLEYKIKNLQRQKI